VGKKGGAYEREVAEYFRQIGCDGAERNLEQTRKGGADVNTRLPIAIECKHRKRHDVWATMRQVDEAAMDGEQVVGFLKKKNGRGRPSEEIVCFRKEFAMELIKLWADTNHIKGE